jgi:hypothetical protein
MFEYLKRRIEEIRRSPTDILRAAAPRIEAKLRSDATTKRGNVPSYGKFGDIPIAVDVRSGQINVTGAEWVIEKAKKEGQPAEWAEIIQEEAHRILGGGR